MCLAAARGPNLQLAIFIHPEFSFWAWQVGEGNQDAGIDDNEEEEDAEEGSEGVAVEDMAVATFKGHADAVYCVAVNPKVPSQVGEHDSCG